MSKIELIERLTSLIKLQADIIKEQANALAQLGSAEELDKLMMKAEKERQDLIEDQLLYEK